MPKNEKSKSTQKREAIQKEPEKKEEGTTEAEAGKTTDNIPEETKESKATEAGKSDSDVVEVSKEDMRAFMKRLEDVELDNKRLIEASDKSRMAAISERERGEKSLLPQVKLTRMGSATGPLVVAWKMTKNESYVDGTRLVEKQEIELFFQDGTSEKMPLIGFYRKQNKHTIAEIISRTKKLDDPEEGEMLRVRIKGTTEEIDIDLKFVN